MARSSKIPELLAPVGNFETLMAAFDNGADAVYLGLKKFSARARAENFTPADLKLILPYAHQRGRRVYVALNTLLRGDELKEAYRSLELLAGLKADAVIIQDLGLLQILRREFPELPVHLSTQLTIHNAAGLEFFAALGCKRAVLGRELSLEEIAGLTAVSPLEIEVFVYGALCISVAGLCSFSAFFGGQSANRGRCSQPCRRPYRLNEQEGYYLSPADFSALEFLPGLVKAGIHSCKIEGRMKGSQYVATAVRVFRRALDEIKGRGELSPARIRVLREELREAYGRSTTTANLRGEYAGNIIEPGRAASIGRFIGKIRRVQAAGKRNWRVRLSLKEDLQPGDRLKLISPGRDGSDNSFTAKESAAAGGKGETWLNLPLAAKVGDLLLKVGHRDEYGQKGGAWWRRQMAEDPANKAGCAGIAKPVPLPPWLKDLARRPESVENETPRQNGGWLLKLADWRAARPFLQQKNRRLALELNGRVRAATGGREGQLFRRHPELEWSLPALTYPGQENEIAAAVSRLLQAGFRRFHLNGLDHLAWFTASDPQSLRLATGPLLHAANPAAIDFYADQGFKLVHLTPEMDRQSLAALRPRPGIGLALTMFAFPLLFPTRLPLDLQRRPLFSRRREELFCLRRDGLSYLVGTRPFSLLEEKSVLDSFAPALKIIDLRYVPPAFDYSRFHNPRHFRLADLKPSSGNYTGNWI